MKKTLNIIKKSAASFIAIAALTLGFAFIAPMASAACDPSDLTLANGAGCAQGGDQATELFGDDGIFTTIVNTVLFVIGAISVMMLIYGGIRYTVSGGESGAVTNAKNTILYAIVGIVVSILAYAAVNFVISSLAVS